jgi:uncharacterized protein
MILAADIATIASKQLKNHLSKTLGITRSDLATLKLVPNFALIITGIRRSGKTTLLHQLLATQQVDTFFLNFEDTRFVGFETDDYTRLLTVIQQSGSKILFFDEIQFLPNWELFIRQLLDDDYQVIVTGSNATLLSKELGTKLTGRHLSRELLPFSYKEFLTFFELQNSVSALESYMQKGGFPEYLKNDNGAILNQLLDDIINRDIIVRYSVKDAISLKRLAVYLISNIGKPVAGNKLKELFAIKSTTTILEYFSYLENTYVVQFVQKFSFSLKTQIRNPKKVYVIDLGLFSQNSIVFSDENGRSLENLVYLHLRRNYREIYYFNEKKECDFVVMKNGQIVQLIQVCYLLSSENLDREISGLVEAMDFFGIQQGTIVSYNQSEVLKKEGRTITVKPAWEFMMM